MDTADRLDKLAELHEATATNYAHVHKTLIFCAYAYYYHSESEW